MISYGGSITSAFPNTFCSSPNSMACQLCNKGLTDSGLNSSNSNNSYLYFSMMSQAKNRAEKCTHCGINICDSCFNENHEQNIFNYNQSNEALDEKFSKANNNQYGSLSHYNLVKKDFKQMYNYSKEIVEKLHFLNNAIKIEESAINELNSIKHQVNTKALELIKQVNQEKVELMEQIENAKRKYETTLNERKEYYALSMQYKDELRKVIRRYKDSKIDEQCSLNDLLKMYLSVKTISKSLDDYDHIKLITEEEPLQVNFEERPVYRSVIGKLLLNHLHANEFFANESQKLNKKSNSSTTSFKELTNEKYITEAQLEPTQTGYQSYNKSVEDIQYQEQMTSEKNTRINQSNRSVSLNDLIDTNELNENKPEPILVNLRKQTPSLVKKKSNKIPSNGNSKNVSKSINNLLIINEKIKPSSMNHQPFYLPARGGSQKEKDPSSLSRKSISPKPPLSPKLIKPNSTPNTTKKSILKNSETNQNQNNFNLPASVPGQELLFKRMEKYKEKMSPKERLEIDILPSFLNFSNNKLLVASSAGKIRVIDLVNFKIQKDELKNILINGICRPRSNDSDTFYAVTNGEIKSRNDELNVSNSTIIVTKTELKVLKKNSINDNDNYLFTDPSGICYDNYENLYICDSGNNRIKVLDKNFLLRNTIETATSSDDFLSLPESVAIYKNTLYVCDSGNHRIIAFSIVDNGADFRFKSMFGISFGNNPSNLRCPLDICVDSMGILSVRDKHLSRIQIFSPDCVPFHSIEINSHKETIYSVAVGDGGDIFVSKMISSQEYDQNGQMMQANKYFIDIY